jgi:hypothetical protein
MLTLPEQWILLNLDEQEGKIRVPRSVFQCGITGGILLELAFSNCLRLEEGKKNVIQNKSSALDDPLLEKALGWMRKARKPKTILNWMIQLTMQESHVIESFYFHQMVEQNMITKESRTVMGIFKSKRFFPVSRDLQAGILQSLKDVIQKITPKGYRPLCLAGLITHSGHAEKILGKEQSLLLNRNFPDIFSRLEEKHFPADLVPFFLAVLEAFSLSQQTAGAY